MDGGRERYYTRRLGDVRNTVSMAVSAFPRDRLDVSGSVREGRDPYASGSRAIRQDYGTADRAVYDDARSRQLRSVLSWIRRNYLSYRGGDLRKRFLVVEHLCRSEQNKRIGAKVAVRFSYISSFAVPDPGS